MKNKLLLILPTIILSFASLTGCAKKQDNKSSGGGDTTESSSGDKPIYQVTFKNYDEMELYVADVEEGDTAVYQGETPLKPSTAMYDFTFNGWDKDLTKVKESFTTHATYEQTIRKYTITFVNWDGTILQNSNEEYGSTPQYNGPTPTKPSDARAEYTFSGWTPLVAPVQGEATYTATFDASYAPTYRTTGLVYQIQGYNESYSVIGYFGDDTSVVIPQVFDGIPVKGIKAGAFSNHDKLESIFIPKTVENIEAHAFDNCGAITHITVGDDNPKYYIDDLGDLVTADTLVYSLPSHQNSFEVKDQYTTVLSGAFSCSGISMLTISASSFDTLPELFAVDAAHMPNTLNSLIIKGGDIGDEQFMNCQHLRSISLLHTDLYLPVTRVGERAFKGCSSVQTLVFNDALTYIGDEAFMGCTSLRRLKIGSTENISLEHVGNDAFVDLPNVELYSDSGSVKSLGNDNCHDIIAMEPTRSSIAYLYIPATTVAINTGAFENCTSLLEVYLQGGNLRSIGKRAFANCIRLDTLHMNLNAGNLDNIDYIPYDAFNGCTKLSNNKTITDADSGKAFYILSSDTNSSLTVGPEVRGIASNVLAGRQALAAFTVNVDSENPYYTVDNQVLRDARGNVVCGYFYQTMTDVYCGGEYIYPRSFAGQYINSLILDEGVKIIGSGAFDNAETLEATIYLPESLTTIQASAFNHYYVHDASKTALTFFSHENLLSIGSNAFFSTRNINFYTPFAENPSGWETDFDKLGSGYTFNIIYSYGA